uniref:Uncharacterized protein n=1 Tax=Chrysotila carterae TaxID=13221 RepID=A0A7S4BNJ5_CHRCT
MRIPYTLLPTSRAASSALLIVAAQGSIQHRTARLRHLHPRACESHSGTSSSAFDGLPTRAMATSASSMPLSSSSSGALDVTETASKQYRAMKKFVAFPFEYHQELELKIDGLTSLGEGIGRVQLPPSVMANQPKPAKPMRSQRRRASKKDFDLVVESATAAVYEDEQELSALAEDNKADANADADADAAGNARAGATAHTGPRVLWGAFFSLPLRSPLPAGRSWAVPSNLLCLDDSSLSATCDGAVAAARGHFRKICPDADFLPPREEEEGHD